LLRYSARRFRLSPDCRHVAVVLQSPSSSCRVALLLMVLGRLFLLLVLGWSSILPPRRTSLSSSSLLLFACLGWFQFTVISFNSPSLVSICCCWFQFTVVGLDSPSLVLTHRRWFPCRLTPPSPSHFDCPPPTRLTLPPLLLMVSPPHHCPPLSSLVPFRFLLVVVLSCLCNHVAPHNCSFRVSCRPSGRIEGSVRQKKRGIPKTNHDKCRGSHFATHPWGFPLHQSPSSSFLPGSSVERG